MLEGSLFRPSIGVVVTAGGRAADPVCGAHLRCITATVSAKRPFHEAMSPPDAARPAQPAGLRTRRHAPGGAPNGRRFPVSVLSKTSALLTAVVPAYRCGTVPDSHRVPSCDACLTCLARVRRHV